MDKPYKITCAVIGTLIAILVVVLVLYWAKTFTVTFDTKGGTIYQAVEVRPNDTVLKPADPVMEGYNFKGWFLSTTDEEFNFETKIVDDITIVAKWEPVV
ncbi:MAG: InlB B-repeat-containing protein [Bacilli bacterium]|nr:InlB B-repeat-containing protein [Bacilli bacterium]